MPPASNIALYDKTTGKEIVIRGLSYNATDYPVDRFVPVGVVVIPKEHSRVLYPESHECYGKDIIMSLKYMNDYTPDTGGEGHWGNALYWGSADTDLTLPNYSKSAVVANSEAEEESTESDYEYVILPSTTFGSVESKAAPKTYYRSMEDVLSPYCPSPYLWKDGKWGPNPAFYNCPAACM